MGNSLGKLLTVTSFGESHGRGVGVVLDGCPAGLPVTVTEIEREASRRWPGQAGATARAEPDKVEILSGVFQGRTTGAPICLLTWNRDVDSGAYRELVTMPRPGHADYTARVRYGGFNDFRGGGRFSGRITAPLVMAGAIARKLLGLKGMEIMAHVTEIGGIKARPADIAAIREQAGQDPLRCADLEAAARMLELISRTGQAADSLGGVIEGVALNLPAGLGEPVFDNLDGELAKALFAIPAVKGVEFGAGFAAAGMKGSENNDPYAISGGKVVTLTNNAGGVLGGISSGMPLVVRVAVKPTPSIGREQPTVDLEKRENTVITVRGRHDTCIVPRAVAVVEAMMALTISDFALRAGIIPRVLT